MLTCAQAASPGVDAGAGLPGTVHSEEEDAGSRDRKGSSGLNMNVQEGGQEEEAKAESSVLVSDPLLLEGHVMKLVLRSALFHVECMLESTLCV